MRHPDWITVGATVDNVRTFSHNTHYEVARHTVVIARITPTTVVTDTGRRYRVQPDGRYHLRPRYLDYRDYLVPHGHEL